MTAQRSDRESFLGMGLDLEPEFYAQFKRPRCTECHGWPEATETEPACDHCGGTGHEPDAAWEAQQLRRKDHIP